MTGDSGTPLASKPGINQLVAPLPRGVRTVPRIDRDGVADS